MNIDRRTFLKAAAAAGLSGAAAAQAYELPQELKYEVLWNFYSGVQIRDTSICVQCGPHYAHWAQKPLTAARNTVVTKFSIVRGDGFVLVELPLKTILLKGQTFHTHYGLRNRNRTVNPYGNDVWMRLEKYRGADWLIHNNHDLGCEGLYMWISQQGKLVDPDIDKAAIWR